MPTVPPRSCSERTSSRCPASARRHPRRVRSVASPTAELPRPRAPWTASLLLSDLRRLDLDPALRALVGDEVHVLPVVLVLRAGLVGEADHLGLGFDRLRPLRDVRLPHAREEHENRFLRLHGAGEDVAGTDLHRARLAAVRDLKLLARLVVEK